MRRNPTLRILTVGLAALIIMTTMTAVAATNTVPPTRMDEDLITFNINHLRPSACAGLTLTSLITGSGTLTGTAGNDLILASANVDTIDGLGGDDCIVGGASDDDITGGDGSDVCVGGPGTDAFTTCESQVQ